MSKYTQWTGAVMSAFFMASSALASEVALGEKIYARQCMGCHAAAPTAVGTVVLAARSGKEKSVLADRTDLDPAFVRAIVRHGLGIMPGFRPTEINEVEMGQLNSFLTRPR